MTHRPPRQRSSTGSRPRRGTRPAADLDLRSTAELVSLMNAADATSPVAVAPRARRSRGRSTRSPSARRAGGRLVYVGAGTSGRLPWSMPRVRVDLRRPSRAPSSHSSPGRRRARRPRRRRPRTTTTPRRGDSRPRGRRARRRRRAQRERADARTSGVRSTRRPGSRRAHRRRRLRRRLAARGAADHEIAVVVGPEVIAGSTRLKAGTAQKLVLNTISTIAMIGSARPSAT